MIQALYAWVVEEDGIESVPAMLSWETWFPLYATSRSLAEKLREVAESIAREKGLPLRLVRFSAREVLEEVEG